MHTRSQQLHPLLGWRLWLLALALLCGACAPSHEVRKVMQAPPVEPPVLVGARGELSPVQTRAVLQALARQGQGSELLTRHLAVEQALSQTPLTMGNEVDLLRDGAATYRAMYEAIRGARHHINMETYIFRDDSIGHQVAALLIYKRQEGLVVNLIYDSVGSIDTPREFFQQLVEHGVNVLEFNPVDPARARRDWAITQRDHRKLLIVDGRIAITGGINIDSVYSSGSLASPRRTPGTGETPWRDTDIRIEGPAVAQFQKFFLDTWAKQHGPALEEGSYFPRLREPGSAIVRAIGTSPDSTQAASQAALLSAIEHAERSVHVTNAYFVPDEQMLRALEGAARAGVEVTLVLPSHSDFWATLYAGRAKYARLLSAGVRIYERKAALLHAKTAVIDGVWSTVGSTNLDRRSLESNDEIDAVVLGRAFGNQVEAMFLDDLRASEAISAERWRQRSLGSRLRELSAALLENWL